jgi:hypothetical protein
MKDIKRIRNKKEDSIGALKKLKKKNIERVNL